MRVPFEVKIERLQVRADHNFDIFEVTFMGEDKSTWTETMKSEKEVDIFLRGAKAAASFLGRFLPYVEIPEIQSGHFIRDAQISSGEIDFDKTIVG